MLYDIIILHYIIMTAGRLVPAVEEEQQPQLPRRVGRQRSVPRVPRVAVRRVQPAAALVRGGGGCVCVCVWGGLCVWGGDA